MNPSRPLIPVLLRASLALAAGLALVLGAAVQPAAASVPPPVALGIHRFGHLRPPDAIVAHAGPNLPGDRLGGKCLVAQVGLSSR